MARLLRLLQNRSMNEQNTVLSLRMQAEAWRASRKLAVPCQQGHMAHRKQQHWTKQVTGVGGVHVFAGHALMICS